MIDAIFNVPPELLQIDKNKVYTNERAKIIIVFLDDDFNIVDIDKKNYQEWLHDKRISQEAVKLLDCQKFIGASNIKPSRKGFGGQYGMSTCSPIHFKLTNTYLEAIKSYLVDGSNKDPKKKYIDEKIDAFINGDTGLRNRGFFNEIKEKIIPIVKKIFLELMYSNDGTRISIKFNQNSIELEENDYLLIKIEDSFIEYFIREHNLFLGEIESSSNRHFNTESYCFMCHEKITNGTLFPLGKFEREQKKHNQLFHKFYNKINYTPNILICDNCNSRIFSFFKKVNDVRKKHIPVPLNVRVDFEDYKYILFSDDSFLNKLKTIYKLNKDNPFDYIFLTVNNENDFVLEYVSNFKYYLETNNEIIYTHFNKKDGDYLILRKDLFSKGDFIFHLDKLYLNKKIITNRLYSEPKDLKNIDGFLKLIFLEFREPIINFLFKENYWFQKEGIKRLVLKILKNVCEVNRLKDYFLGINGRFILLFYFLYSQSEGVKMEIKNLKEIEEGLNDWENLIVDNDFKAAYLMGQIAYFLLSRSEGKKTVLDLLGTYLLSVKSIDQLKKKLADLTLRYKHKITPTKKWKHLNYLVFSYNFNTNKFDDILVPFFTGFYAENVFFKNEKVINDG